MRPTLSHSRGEVRDVSRHSLLVQLGPFSHTHAQAHAYMDVESSVFFQMNAHIEAQFLGKTTLRSKAEVDHMAAEPRVTARDLVKVVGGKDGGGRERR